MSAPSSSGRCRYGVAKVLSTTTIGAAFFCERGDGLDVDDVQQRIGRRLDPDHARVVTNSRLGGGKIRQVDEAEVEPGAALPHTAEESARAAVEIVHRDDVAAAVNELENRARSPPCPMRTQSRACLTRGRRCSARYAMRVGFCVREYS